MTEQSREQLQAELDRCRERLAALEAQSHERLQLALNLKEAKAHLDMMVDCAEDYAILSLDIENRITMWSNGAERIFGWSEEEVLGKSGAIIFTEEQQAEGAVEHELSTALAEGNAVDERWHRRKDDTLFFASGMMRPMRDEDGTLRGFVKVARDVTLRKLAEQERTELLSRTDAARQRAERAEAQRTRFMAMVIHELRTPLTSIKGFTSTLMAKDIEWKPEQQQEFIEIIDNEADKLAELVNQLLDLSQVEAGTMRIQAIETNASEIVQSAQAQLNSVAGKHKLQIEIEAGLPRMMADPARLAQVLVNLVNNAAKYSPAETPIQLDFVRSYEGIKVSVTDQGPGIPAEMREHVFEAFRQLGENKKRGGGIGLGLAICKGIIEAHHGRIWIEDGQRHGTTVSFTIPAMESMSSES